MFKISKNRLRLVRVYITVYIDATCDGWQKTMYTDEAIHTLSGQNCYAFVCVYHIHACSSLW